MPSTRPTPQKLLGLRIKELRVDKGITQEELADRAGFFRTYMSRIESGQANPTLTTLYALADALEESVQSLLQPPASLTPPERVRSSEALSRGRVKR